MKVALGDVLFVDERSASLVPPAFEKHFRTVVVLDALGAELRQYEQLGPAKYAVHTERMDAPVPTALSPERERAFLEAIRRSGKAVSDIREAVRMALKALP